jgi:hypothetical protein
MEIRLVFCNLAYNRKWYTDLRKQNPNHFLVFDAIFQEIFLSQGQDISLDRIRENLSVQGKEQVLDFSLLPSRGQLFGHNGTGIRHAKYSKAKNIAVIWERIGEVIYVTFDDHAPIRYHRAIYFFREIRLGRMPIPRQARDRRRFVSKLYRYWSDRRKYKIKGVRPGARHYE